MSPIRSNYIAQTRSMFPVENNMAETETVYCLCRKPYDESEFMIECDVCKDWYHGSCVGVQEHQASDIEIYHCPNCQLTHGPLLLKKRRNFHRHDYSEDDVGNKAVQTGTVVFIKELKNRTFPSGDEIPILRLHGSELTPEFFNKHGFDTPILVEKKDGLSLTVPPRTFTIQDVENNVGSMREIDVIDVSKQEDCKMLMREWTEYYNSPNRAKIFNVISLEFSSTRLSDMVTPPIIVQQLSWVSNLWPDKLPDDCVYTRPEVQKYCLMGVKDSFTDFHIDFGGTSVWYHVLWGEKVFYMIRPTQANIALYESWVSSSNQSETFFGDQVDVCYKCVVKQGQTFFIPTGWIHAVFTPIDSLVFGGNFLHDYNISLQLQVYDIEKRVGTPSKYLFPSFETTNWYAAKHIYDIIKEYTDEERIPPSYLVQGAKALGSHLKSWTQRKDLNNLHLFVKDAKHEVPEHVQYGRLLKEMSKEIKSVENMLKNNPVKVKGEKIKKKKKNTMPTPKQMANIDLLHQHTQEKLQEMQHEQKAGVYNFKDEEDENTPASLKVRIPKAGAYMDTKQEVKSELDDLSEKPIGLKLKVSNGKIISDIGKKIQGTKSFQPLVGEEGKEEDSDTDNLVVDENPRRGKRAPSSSSASTMKPGSLKLKLSFHGKPIPPGTSSQESSQESESTASQSESEGLEDRRNLPTIRGGLNGSIADILEASGYGTETTFAVDEDVGRASPSMREAIQGMLSMSQMNEIELFAKGNKSRQRSQLVMDEEERLQNCYKDDEFVYPDLEMSDEEDGVIKSKTKHDDNWNPKARVQVTIPKGDRPHREGAKKEAVEKILAAAAAKPAVAQKPKKIKKRSKSETLPEPVSTPGTALSSSSGSAFRPNLSKPIPTTTGPESPTKAKKPRKGQATAKQRLGKILKIHKLGMF